MNFWWDKKVDKASIVETFRQIAELIKTYEKYEFGIKYLVPQNLHTKVQKAAKAIKQVESCQAYYQEMESLYKAIKVLNNSKTLNNPQVAAKAFGQVFQSAGFIVGKLPSPANMYSSPLIEIGKNFEKIVNTYMPSAHGSAGLDDDFREFLGGGHSFINGR